jgi:hypothetical protein
LRQLIEKKSDGQHVLEGEVLRASERHRVDVLPIIRERHKLLTEANGVLARWNTIINFEVFLGNALRGIRNAVRNKGTRTGNNVLFEGSTFQYRGFQHPGGEAAGPEFRRQREGRGRERKR